MLILLTKQLEHQIMIFKTRYVIISNQVLINSYNKSETEVFDPLVGH